MKLMMVRRTLSAALCAAVTSCSDGTGPEAVAPGTFRFVLSGARNERITGPATIHNPFPDFYTIVLQPPGGGPNAEQPNAIRVEAPAPVHARRRGEKTHALVVAHRRRAEPAPARHLADGQLSARCPG